MNGMKCPHCGEVFVPEQSHSVAYQTEWGLIALNAASKELFVGRADATPLQRQLFDIAEKLMRAPMQVFSPAQLAAHTGSSSFLVGDWAKMQICRLRSELGRDTFGRCFQSVKGVGYRFNPNGRR